MLTAHLPVGADVATRQTPPGRPATTLLAALSVLSAGAVADELVSRHSHARWVHTEFPYDGHGPADWTDEASFDLAGAWNVSFPHGWTHADSALANLMRGEFTGSYRASPSAPRDARTEIMLASFRLDGPRPATLDFSGEAQPVPGPATSSRNIDLVLVDLDSGEVVFDLFRDAQRTNQPGDRALWSSQTWTATLPAGTYELRAVADQLDWATVGGDSVADSHLIFQLTIGLPGCPADFNHDGFLDFFDYRDYADCFESGFCPPGSAGDFNGDGFVDFFDYRDFVDAFEAGC